MKPYYEDDCCQIFHGDCRAVLPTLEPGSVDLVLTDPPYGVGYSSGWCSGVVRSNTRLVNDVVATPLLGDTVPLIDALLGNVGCVYVFSAPEKLDVVMPVLRHHWSVTNILVWDKGNCTAGDLQGSYGEQWEAIVYARRRRVRLVGGRDRDILKFSRCPTAQYLHPTQKPLALFSYLVSRHTGSIVLDPFMGSGTTLLAAKNLGRKAIGIEVEERYCELAATRLQQEVLPLSTESSASPLAKAEALFEELA